MTGKSAATDFDFCLFPLNGWFLIFSPSFLFSAKKGVPTGNKNKRASQQARRQAGTHASTHACSRRLIYTHTHKYHVILLLALLVVKSSSISDGSGAVDLILVHSICFCLLCLLCSFVCFFDCSIDQLLRQRGWYLRNHWTSEAHIMILLMGLSLERRGLSRRVGIWLWSKPFWDPILGDW